MMSAVYLKGKTVINPDENPEHVSPVKSYNAVFAGLLVLTGLTYAVSYMSLGAASLLVAMIVAVIKASLVCAYFMHLKYDNRYHVFVFVGTILFVAIFFGFTIYDITSRGKINDEQETFARLRDQAAAGEPLKVGVHNHPNPQVLQESMEKHHAKPEQESMPKSP